MKLPHKTLEKKLFKSGYRYICAVDEVGVGCLAGPVVVCAVGVTSSFYKKPSHRLSGLRESKSLSPKQREKFAQELLRQKGLIYAVTYSYPKKIDEINIYQAARGAMRRAIQRLCNIDKKSTRGILAESARMPLVVLVDGKAKIRGLRMDQLAIVKGDRKVFAIACASIIAKVFRDKMMVRYAKKFPGYGFEKNKGYGTKYHQIQLTSLGPCAIHRRSFRLIY